MTTKLIPDLLENMGSYDSPLIPDNQTIKQNIETVAINICGPVSGQAFLLGSGGSDTARLTSAFQRSLVTGTPVDLGAISVSLPSDLTLSDGSYAYFPKGFSYGGSGKIRNAIEEHQFYKNGSLGSNYTQSSPRIGYLWKRGDSYGPDVWQGNWSVSSTYWQWSDYEWMFYREFGQNSTSSPNGWPQATVCHMAISKDNNLDFTAATHNIVVVAAEGGSGWCENNIALTGLDPFTSIPSSIRFITCGEDDMQPSQNCNVLGGAGRLINSFWKEVNFAGLAIAKDAGGGFAQGIWIEGVTSSGTGIQFANGASMTTGIDLSFSSFSGAAIALAQDDSILVKRAGGGDGFRLEGDGAGNAKLFLRNSSTALKVIPVDESENEPAFVVESPINASQSIVIRTGLGPFGNTSPATLKVRSNSVTGRGITTGGTVNASGADYAEYEIKREDCGEIAKGQIIGFDEQGLLTDRWDLAVSFGVKSSDPNLVGGDTWADSLGERPDKPTFVSSIDWTHGTRPVGSRSNPGKLWDGGPRPTSDDEAQAAWDIARQVYDEEWSHTLLERQMTWDNQRAAFDEQVANEISEFESGEVVRQWEEDVIAWDASYQSLRSRVDRIAYCGKVPVNIMDGNVGQYVIPTDNDGSIGYLLTHTPSFEQYLVSIGRIRKILKDGRAQLSVKSN